MDDLYQRAEEVAVTHKMNSSSHVQKFAKSPDTKEPNSASAWSSKALLLVGEASQKLLPHPEPIQPEQPVPWTSKAEPHLRWEVGYVCLGQWWQEPGKQFPLNRQIFSILHLLKHEIQVRYVFVLVLLFGCSFNQNHAGDVFNCCHQIFTKGSQLHQIIQTLTTTGSEKNTAAFIHTH